MSTFYKSKSKGFTLIELLVVIAIIGTLATLLLLQLGVARAKGRDTKRIANINQIRTAVELYFDDNAGAYPVAISTALLGKYIANGIVPTDPIAAAGAYKYSWTPLASPTKFQVYSELETKSTAINGDSDINSTGWSGNAVDGSLAASEGCGAYVAGAATQCIFDVGQK